MIFRATVKNYKSIKKTVIDLPKFSAIIGRNGAGKSNFISAISLIKKLIEGLPINIAAEYSEIFPTELFYLGTDNLEASFEFEIKTMKEKRFKFGYSIKNQKTDSGPKLIISSEILDEIIENDQGKVETKEIYRRNRDRIEFSDKEIKSSSNLSVLALPTLPTEQFSDLIETIKGYRIIEAFEQGKNNANDKRFVGLVSRSPDLKVIDGLLVALYKRDREAYQKALRAISQVIPGFKSPKITDLSPALQQKIAGEEKTENKNGSKVANGQTELHFVTWNESFIKQGLTSNASSGGNVRTILILLTLFYLPKHSCLCIEEIDNGIHTGRMAKLIDILRTESHNNRVQILFTTHSIELLNSLTAKEVISCRFNRETGSEYVLISDSKDFKIITDELGSQITARDAYNSGFFN